MAVKYSRDSYVAEGHGDRGRFHRPLRKPPGELRNRLRAIYLGIGAFTALMFIAYAMGWLKPAEWGPPAIGTGEVMEKSTLTAEDESVAYAIELALSDDGHVRTETVAVDKSTFDALAVGDRLTMRYRISRDDERLLIESLEPLESAAE